MGKTNKKSENLFKWSIHRNSDRHNGANEKKKLQNHYSSYSIVPATEVTQGAVEVWATLPDEIRHDPSLLSFRQQHERMHGEHMPNGI